MYCAICFRTWQIRTFNSNFVDWFMSLVGRSSGRLGWWWGWANCGGYWWRYWGLRMWPRCIYYLLSLEYYTMHSRRQVKQTPRNAVPAWQVTVFVHLSSKPSLLIAYSATLHHRRYLEQEQYYEKKCSSFWASSLHFSCRFQCFHSQHQSGSPLWLIM